MEISSFLILGLTLAASLIIKEFFNFLNLPAVVGQILAGIIFGLPLVKPILFDTSSLNTLEFLSDIGVLFLLFITGLELDVEKFKEVSKDAALIAFSSALFPFTLGFLFLKSLDYSTTASLVFGISLALTSEATKSKVLIDMGKLKTKLGTVMIAAGAFDDIIEVLAIALILALAHSAGFFEIGLIPIQIGIFLASLIIMYFLAKTVIAYAAKRDTEVELFSVLVIFLFLTASLSELLGLGFLIGGIISGIILQLGLKSASKKERQDIKEAVKLITLAFVVPFFFINVGLKVDLSAMLSSPVLLVGAPLIAISGTIIGTLAIKPFTTLTAKQLYLIGWAMNSRGAVELVVVLTALKLGLISAEVFSAIAATTLISTFIFPFILQREIIKDPAVMDGEGILRRIFHKSD